MRIVPDPRVAVGDAAALLHRGRLDEYDAGAALGELAEMDEMPVGDFAVARRVLAHRRNDDAVPQLDVADLQLVKQHASWSSRRSGRASPRRRRLCLSTASRRSPRPGS